jgi:hypothetical protein
VVVHLLRQLARELDGLDMRAKRASEDALDEGLDPVFDAAKDVHWRDGANCAPRAL